MRASEKLDSIGGAQKKVSLITITQAPYLVIITDQSCRLVSQSGVSFIRCYQTAILLPLHVTYPMSSNVIQR